MDKYSDKQIEQLEKNEALKTVGVDKEEFIRFLTYKNHYPIKIIMVGKTYPSDNYYVSREKSDISVMEYINSGEGYIYINGKKTLARQGDFIYLKEGAKHNYRSKPDNPYTKTWVNFNSEIMDALAEKVGVADAVMIRCPEVGTMFDSIINTSANIDINSSVVNAIFQLMISIILRAGDELNMESSYTLADKIKELLDCSIYNNKNISDISNELKYSRQQVSKAFIKKFGMTPIEYLNDKKIKTAMLALKYSNMSISDICNMLSFSSQQYFSLFFKKKTGLNPIAYRKKCCRGFVPDDKDDD